LEGDAGLAVSHALKAGRPGDPVRVRRLDSPDQDYFLVPWVADEGTLLVAHLNAASGEVAGFASASRPGPPVMIDPGRARTVAEERLHHTVSRESEIVWQPCQESASPFLPFYRFESAAGAVYVRADGTVFYALTPFGKGG
jgi:hypothetical protein